MKRLNPHPQNLLLIAGQMKIREIILEAEAKFQF